MAACLVDDTTNYHQTNNTMERTRTPTPPTTSTNNSDLHLCLCSEYQRLKSDSTSSNNGESNRKRLLSQTDNKCNSNDSQIGKTTDCPSTLLSPSKAVTTPTRPTTLFLTNSIMFSSSKNLHTCLSHPTTPSANYQSNSDNTSSPLKFCSLPEISSPPAKRHRPQTLTISSPFTIELTDIQSKPNVPTLSIRLTTPTELAEKLKEKIPITIFDCGSIFRHSEHRIRNSILLRVANKIARKRLKLDFKQNSTIDIKQLKESQFIFLYDDNTNNHRHSIHPMTLDDERLSPAFKSVCEEIQCCLKTNIPPIFILNCSFNQFFDLYPHLCESLQPRSCPSSPTNHCDESSTPQTAPPIKNDYLLTTITNQQKDIDNHPMTHIIDGIYIGSESNAKNFDELVSEQIRYIVNVTSHVPLYHLGQINYCHLPADDTQKQNLLEYFDEAYTFICNVLEKNEKVLVHCVAGISRSPAIVIGFLMRHTKMNMNDAYDFVKRKRSIVSPNLNFMGQLLEYEKKLNIR